MSKPIWSADSLSKTSVRTARLRGLVFSLFPIGWFVAVFVYYGYSRIGDTFWPIFMLFGVPVCGAIWTYGLIVRQFLPISRRECREQLAVTLLPPESLPKAWIIGKVFPFLFCLAFVIGAIGILLTIETMIHEVLGLISAFIFIPVLNLGCMAVVLSLFMGLRVCHRLCFERLSGLDLWLIGLRDLTIFIGAPYLPLVGIHIALYRFWVLAEGDTIGWMLLFLLYVLVTLLLTPFILARAQNEFWELCKDFYTFEREGRTRGIADTIRDKQQAG